MPSKNSEQDMDLAGGFKDLTVRRLLDRASQALELKVLAGEKGLDRHVVSWNLDRPGLAFAGFFQQFYANRIQILGGNEVAYLDSLSKRKRVQAIRRVVEQRPPCLILTTAFTPPEGLVEECEADDVTLLRTPLRTSLFASKLTTTLMLEFAPSVTAHGSLIDVFGLGVLLSGKSGVGKSECALELIARGHRLVADDVVIIKRIAPNRLVGCGSEVLKYHMEIHGLGIVDIQSLYGIGSVISECEIDLHIHLEQWETGKSYERLGIEDRFTSILGVLIPEYVIPIEPGRNISIIVETAALNQKMKEAGVNVAARFNERLIGRMKPTIPAETVYLPVEGAPVRKKALKPRRKKPDRSER